MAGLSHKAIGQIWISRRAAFLADLCELPPESSLDAKIPLSDRVVERGRHFNDLPFLGVNRQFAPHAAIRTDCLRARLLRLLPGARLPHVVLGLEHQRARRQSEDFYCVLTVRGAPRTAVDCAPNRPMRGAYPPYF